MIEDTFRYSYFGKTQSSADYYHRKENRQTPREQIFAPLSSKTMPKGGRGGEQTGAEVTPVASL
jgi:hypothetical protein